MKSFGIAALCLALAIPISAASADHWNESGKARERGDYYRYDDRDDDDDRGRGYSRHRVRHEGRERKIEYDDGVCKVEQNWGKDGEYKEERKCRGGYGHHGPRYGFGSNPGYGWVDPAPYRYRK